MSCGCRGDRCQIGPDDPRHGTFNAYTNHFCRCESCTEGNRQYIARKRAAAAKEKCPNCGGKGGYYRKRLCSACYRYQDRVGRPRPRELFARKRRKTTPKPATVDNPMVFPAGPTTLAFTVAGKTYNGWQFTCPQCGWETPPTLNMEAAEATRDRHVATSHRRRKAS